MINKLNFQKHAKIQKLKISVLPTLKKLKAFGFVIEVFENPENIDKHNFYRQLADYYYLYADSTRLIALSPQRKISVFCKTNGRKNPWFRASSCCPACVVRKYSSFQNVR